jgi:hypothetical protein
VPSLQDLRSPVRAPGKASVRSRCAETPTPLRRRAVPRRRARERSPTPVSERPRPNHLRRRARAHSRAFCAPARRLHADGQPLPPDSFDSGRARVGRSAAAAHLVLLRAQPLPPQARTPVPRPLLRGREIKDDADLLGVCRYIAWNQSRPGSRMTRSAGLGAAVRPAQDCARRRFRSTLRRSAQRLATGLIGSADTGASSPTDSRRRFLETRKAPVSSALSQ